MNNIKQKLKQLVEQPRGAGRAVDWAIQSLIVVSLIVFSISTLPDLTATAHAVLYSIEVVVVLIFTAEYALRVYVATHRRKFIFSFFGVIDLLAIAPFYLLLGVDLLPLRALRILKLLRYNQSTRLFLRAFALARGDIGLFLSAAAMLLYLSAVGIYHFEKDVQPDAFGTVFSGLWWAVATLTTVGYGDVYPITVGGRIFTFCILVIGLVVIAAPSGLIAAALTQARKLEEEENASNP